jgi:hypothetical protein
MIARPGIEMIIEEDVVLGYRMADGGFSRARRPPDPQNVWKDPFGSRMRDHVFPQKDKLFYVS